MPDQKIGIFRRILAALQNVYFVWTILLIDIALVLWAMIVRPQVFQYTWAKVLIFVAAAKALLVFLGIVENDRLKNPYKDLNEFLLNPFAWSAVLLFSLIFWVAIASVGLNPPTLTVSLEATPLPSLPTSSDGQMGFLSVGKPGEPVLFYQHVRLDTSIAIPYIEPYAGYKIFVIPDDAIAYAPDSGSAYTGMGRTLFSMNIKPRPHLVRFVLTPTDADLSIQGHPTANRVLELTKGTYRYVVSRLNFEPKEAPFQVPLPSGSPAGVVTVELAPATIQTKFYADRGIGRKVIPIDGTLTLGDGSSLLADSLRTGATIGIPVGRKITARVTARGAWDLSSRIYRGDTSFVLDGSVQKREIWIKVVERF